jgi:hypothetical protein
LLYTPPAVIYGNPGNAAPTREIDSTAGGVAGNGAAEFGRIIWENTLSDFDSEGPIRVSAAGEKAISHDIST